MTTLSTLDEYSDKEHYKKMMEMGSKEAHAIHLELIKLGELKEAALQGVREQYDRLFEHVINGGKL